MKQIEIYQGCKRALRRALVTGNIISIFVYFSPLPTFIHIYRSKATLGFQSLPYVLALFSAMLWMFYALLITDAILLISINSIGCVVETIYILVFLIYASKDARKQTLKLVGSLNVVLFAAILLFTMFTEKGAFRVQVVGWICVAVSVCVFAAPLSVVFQVVRTKSVEFMPFSLSFTLTLSAVLWFAYGLLKRDLYVTVPNVLGFVLGMVQMVLYGVYRSWWKEVEMEKRVAVEHVVVEVNHDTGNGGPPATAPVTQNENKLSSMKILKEQHATP
jgi:solute carrier family 50 protein (sugar transporter)